MEDDYDIRLLAKDDNTPVLAHSNKLAQYSKLIEGLLVAQQELSTPIKVAVVERNILEQLVRYCYESELELTENNLYPLLEGADFLQLDAVLRECCRFIRRCNLNQTDWVGILRFVSRGIYVLSGSEQSDLINFVEQFVLKNLCEFVRGGRGLWENFKLEEIQYYLAHNELNVLSEEDVYDVVVHYCKIKGDGCYSCLMEVVKLNRLDLHTVDRMTRRFPHLKWMYDAAVKWQNEPESRTENPLTKSRSQKGQLLLAATLEPNRDGKIFVLRYDHSGDRWHEVLVKFWPFHRAYHSLVCFEGNLLFIGSDSSQSLDLKDPSRLKEYACLQSVREDARYGVVRNELYVIGGYNGTKYLDTVERWNKGTSTWEKQVGIDVPRGGAAVVTDEDNLLLFVIGGMDSSGALNTVECYNPFTGMWTERAPMLHKRCNAGAAAANGRIYVVGGCVGEEHLITVEMYNFYENAWTQLASLSVICSFATCVFFNNSLMAVGCTAQRQSVLEAYDAKTNTWKRKRSLKYFAEYKCVACAVPHGNLWI